MLDKFTQFIERHLAGPMEKLGSQRHLRAVRDGIVSTLPLIIVSSFFMILAFPPLPQSWGIYQFLSSNATTILLPYRMTMYIMSLYAAFGIGYSLSRSYKLDGLSGGILATTAFLLTFTPVNIPAEALDAAGTVGFVLPMANLGSAGMFVAIITSILAVEIYRLTDKSKFKITMPEQVPPAVARSFEALTPTLVIILGMGAITYYIGFDWHTIVAKSRRSFSQCRRYLAKCAFDHLLDDLLLVIRDPWCFYRWVTGSSIMVTVVRRKYHSACFRRYDSQYRSRTILSMVHLDRWGGFNDWFGYLVSVSHQIGIRFKTRKNSLNPSYFQHQRTTDFWYTDRFEPNLDPTFHHCTTDQWRHCVGRYLSWFSQCSYGQCPLDIAWTHWRFLSDWRRLACDRAKCSFDSFIDPDLLPIRKIYDKNELEKENQPVAQ